MVSHTVVSHVVAPGLLVNVSRVSCLLSCKFVVVHGLVEHEVSVAVVDEVVVQELRTIIRKNIPNMYFVCISFMFFEN